MDKLKWYTRQHDKQIAEVPMLDVTFVARTYETGGIRSEVFVGHWQPGEEHPPYGGQILVAATHTRGDMEDAKDNCLRAFNSWAGLVAFAVTGESNGQENIYHLNRWPGKRCTS